MNRVVLLALCAALLSLSAAVARAEEAPGIGAVAPDVTLTDTDGNAVKIADLRESTADGGEKKEGKVAVITFWSYKCPTGADYMDRFGKLAAWCKEKGVAFFAVDSYGETAEQAKKYREKNGLEYPIYMDEATGVAQAFGARKVTATYVLDAQGKLAYMGAFDNGAEAGAGDYEALAQQAVEQVLKGEAVSKPVTKAKG